MTHGAPGRLSDAKRTAVPAFCLVLGSLTLVGGAPAPAQAACSRTSELASNVSTPGQSDNFKASSGCDGVYAIKWVGSGAGNYAMGQYKKDGSWMNSSYGFVLVPNAAGSGGRVKMIGDTVPDRLCRVVKQIGVDSIIVDH